MVISALPTEEVVEYIAKHCNVDDQNVYIAVAPTSSIAGSVQISARIVETGIHNWNPSDSISTPLRAVLE
jgi:methenyltetrahydromethanopterin cyclohydrolase